MTEWLILMLVAVAGMGLGTFFFAGLWWTVRHGLTTRHPALLFSGSLLLRVAVVVGGFYLVADGDWRCLVACLTGFVIARWLVTRWTRRQDLVAAEQGGAEWN